MRLNPRLTILLPFLVAAATGADDKVGTLPKESPFVLRGGATTPTAAANETIEFAGVSSMGKRTDLIFYDKTSKKSHWIAQGETKEGISVVSYDERRDEAVVKVNGVQKTLTLRKVASPATARGIAPLPTGFNIPAPAAVPAPVPAQLPVANAPAAPTNAAEPAAAQPTPPAGSPAEIQKKQETEARMLVSDLLEIGMAQRRAYEEAQRRAAEGNTNSSPQNATPAPEGTTQPQQTQPAR